MEAFSKLPLDLLPSILEHLRHDDLKNARLVSKNFNFAVLACGFFHHVSLQLPEGGQIPSLGGLTRSNGSPDADRRGEELLSVITAYISTFKTLLLYRRPDWLHHVTIHAAALLPLTGALTHFNINDLRKLTVLLDKSEFPDRVVAACIHTITAFYSRVFMNVKDLSVVVKDILTHSFSFPFSHLTLFAANHAPNLEKLTLKTALSCPALPARARLISSRYGIYNFGCWNYLHTLHLKGFVLEIIPFANLIHKQPSLEFVLLETLNLTSIRPIPEEFNGSAWVWFFHEFGKVDNKFLRSSPEDPIVLRPAVWAKMKFYVDQLSTLDVFEECDKWEFRNVMKLSDYVPK